MAIKKSKEDLLIEIKKSLNKKLIIGADKTIKNLRSKKIKKIFLSSNCPEKIKKDIIYYSKLSKVDVVELGQRNDELGVICKKSFPISVLSLSK